MHLLHLITFIISFMLMLAPANACQCLIKGTRTNNADGTRACCKGRLVNSGDNVNCDAHSMRNIMTEFAICCAMQYTTSKSDCKGGFKALGDVSEGDDSK